MWSQVSSQGQSPLPSDADLVTHDRDIALQADRIISFGDGRIVRDEAVRA